ncbi:hypothetical protein STANM309S_05376 [Streptomyces tanashiensis]
MPSPVREYRMVVLMRRVWSPSVRRSGSRLPSRAVMSRGSSSSRAEWSVSGLSSTKVSPAARAVKRMTLRDWKVSSPVVRSRSTR